LRQGEQELALVELVCEKSATAVDVGANIGVYTYFAAKYSSHVYALEPVPEVAASSWHPVNVTVLRMEGNHPLRPALSEPEPLRERCDPARRALLEDLLSLYRLIETEKLVR
jgi:hypothetical protein